MTRNILIALSIFNIISIRSPNLTDEPDIDKVVASLKGRHRRLQNVVIEYEQQKTFTPQLSTDDLPRDDASSNQPQRTVTIEGTSRNMCVFRFLDGQARYECEIVDGEGTAFTGEMPRKILAFSRERAETLYRQRHESWDNGLISADDPLPDDAVVDYMLGLRFDHGQSWLADEDWKKAAVRQRGRLVELEWPEPGALSTHVWTADPAKGYAFVQYHVIYKGRVAVLGVADDFRETDGLLLPYSIDWRVYGPAGPDATPVYSAKLRIARYQIGAPDNTAERFLIEWPKDSIVLDNRNGATIIVRDGPRVLDDAYLQSLARGEQALGRKSRFHFVWLGALGALIGLAAVVVLFRVKRVRSISAT